MKYNKKKYSEIVATNKRLISFIGLSILLVTPAYAINSTENLAKPDIAAKTLADTERLEQDALQVLTLIDQSKNLREQLPHFVDESNQAIKKHNGALPSAYALRMAKALSEAHELRDSLFKQALSHRSALYRVDNQIDDKARVTEIVIAMSSAVTLFENSKEMHNALDNNHLLRSKLNEGYPEFGIPEGFYDSSTMRSNNPEYRKTFGDAVSFFADNKSEIEFQISQSSPSIQSLYSEIAQSPMIKGLKGSNVFKDIFTLPVKAADGAVDLSERGLNKIKFTSSKVVGNTMGLVRWRAGVLANLKTMPQCSKTCWHNYSLVISC